jgi:uroporphyrinogen decarboxylase
MNKRERIERTIAGEATDRLPVALWRPFPGDDVRSIDLAESLIAHQRAYDWDFLVVPVAPSLSVTDYGTADEYRGAIDGERVLLSRLVRRSLDWTTLRPHDPSRGASGRLIDAANTIASALEDTPVLPMLYSPFTQACQLAERETLLQHMRLEPDRVHSGLSILTESLLRLVDACRRSSVAGFYYVVDGASYDLLTEEEYRIFGLMYDLKVLEAIPSRQWLNVIELRGRAPMFKFAAHMPAQVLAWPDRAAEPDLAHGKTLWDRAVAGGLDRWAHMHQGTPTVIREQIRDVQRQTHERRCIVSAPGGLYVTTPLSNVRAARSAIEKSGAA